MARILIADDHPVIRMAVSLLLKKAGHTIIGEVSIGLEVIPFVRNLEPDLVILDIDMPKLDGLSVIKRLRKEPKHIMIVVFSGLDVERYSIRCSRAGALAFVSKGNNLSHLLDAVQTVLAGYKMFPSTVFSTVATADSELPEEQLLKTLSDREITILRNIASGYRIKDIAKELMISDKTVSTYKSRLIVKLKVNNFIELVELAKRNKLISCAESTDT